MKKLITKILTLLCFTMIVSVETASAMSFTNIETVMEIWNCDGLKTADAYCRGDLDGVYLTLNGQDMKIKPTLQYTKNYSPTKILGGYINLMNSDETFNYISFPLNKCGNVKVYKISSNEGNDFLLVRTYSGAANGSSSCRGLWLVGQNGRQFITYATFNTLLQAGLGFPDIRPSIQDGKICIVGFARYYANGPAYHGVPYHYDPESKGAYCITDPIYLYWDDNAQWFGVESPY